MISIIIGIGVLLAFAFICFFIGWVIYSIIQQEFNINEIFDAHSFLLGVLFLCVIILAWGLGEVSQILMTNS